MDEDICVVDWGEDGPPQSRQRDDESNGFSAEALAEIDAYVTQLNRESQRGNLRDELRSRLRA